MRSVIEIGFKGRRRGFYANPLQFPFEIGDYAIVEAERGEDLGQVLQIGSRSILPDPEMELKKILRKPTPQDLQRLAENRELEKKALEVCKQKAAERGLPMKWIDAEYQFDRNKITFYFTAEQRIDFRELVKDLAAIYRTRIELRQIGAREEARRIGGYGPCGYPLCCTTCIAREFDPITTKCVKDQNLPLNQSKLLGLCGRLKCCLRYEVDFYQSAAAQFPDIGQKIKTPIGTAVVERIDVIKEEVVLRFGEKQLEKYSLDELTAMQLSAQKMKNNNQDRNGNGVKNP